MRFEIFPGCRLAKNVLPDAEEPIAWCVSNEVIIAVAWHLCAECFRYAECLRVLADDASYF